MKTLDEFLNKKPETIKEKLLDLWEDISYYYPQKIEEGWWSVCTFCRNIRKFWGILWKDRDFDHGYMEELLIKKLSWMADYFRTSRIIVEEEKIYTQINLAIRIGKIAFDLDPEKDSPENYGGEFGSDYLGHINTRNYKRFWPSIDLIKFKEKETKWYKYNLDDLRKLKAKTIFYKILDQYSNGWWD